MNVYRRAGLVGLAAVGLAGGVQSAHAGFSGADLSWQYYAAGSAYNPGTQGSETSGTFLADGSVGGTFIAPANGSFDPVFTLSADGTGITFDFSVDTATSPFSSPTITGPVDISNGVAIEIISGATFGSVTLDAGTNMAGFNASDFSFNSGQLNVDFASLPFSTGTVVKLDVTSRGSLATPEPATGYLMLASLAGAALLGRRKTRSI